MSEENIARYASGGFHPVRIGDKFDNGKYRVLRKLGFGVYSTVWLAHNTQTKQIVALKILTADTYDGKKDSYELAILDCIVNKQKAYQGQQENRKDPRGKHVLGLLDTFKHDGPNGQHVCLVFKAMGPNLSQLRDLFPRRRLPVPMAKNVARDLVTALAFLHDECGVIHTDIKPTNILVETAETNDMFQHAPPDVFQQQSAPLPSPHDYYMASEPVVSAHEDLTAAAAVSGMSFRLADFGTASWTTKHLSEWIQPDKLRAPEVILGAAWDSKVDIWNLGLVIWELTTGQLCFDGQATATAAYSSEAHLAQMQAILGRMPDTLLSRASRRDRLESGISFPSFALEDLCAGSGAFGEGDGSKDDREAFVAVVRSMLDLEPHNRPCARDLLESSWLRTAKIE
ncbi:protein kinase domain-containing protein [Sporothrix brasiliensis 5110]|uniref:non-specific serine/threonine protein kinase n=1 Tax=Sporothrix brasiliensis 5110 TaxID=1398154 RepID=A0A0C2J3F1_9PEZI|nr:protein kinase domain-containing protein [Sporothrix brasiliensis 5110]KIH93550.1 protein kinase domain-containing protein [Sporothrix brasiliensis 5110]